MATGRVGAKIRGGHERELGALLAGRLPADNGLGLTVMVRALNGASANAILGEITFVPAHSGVLIDLFMIGRYSRRRPASTR